MLVAAAQLPPPTSSPRRRDPPRPPKALAAILRSRVIACLRAQDGEMAMQAAHAAARGGVSVLEIVMFTPGILEVYPVSVMGGEMYMSALKKPFPLLPMVASQGITTGKRTCLATFKLVRILKTLGVSHKEIHYGKFYKKPEGIQSVTNGLLYDTIHSDAMAPLLGSIKLYMEAGASAVVLSDAIFDQESMRKRKFDEISELANLATLQASQSRK